MPALHVTLPASAPAARLQLAPSSTALATFLSTELHRNPYVLVALFLLLVLIGVQVYRHILDTLKGRMGIVLEERNRIARECHDTLMAGFAAISWQLEATNKLFRENGAADTPAAQSCELARSMVAHCQAEARRIIWDLRGTDEVTNLLSEALGKALTGNTPHGDAEITFMVEGDELPLAPGCVHHLVCIGQEAVSNAIRHARPTRIFVLLKYEEEGLSLSIHDDGCGFHRPVKSEGASGHRHGHFGIPVMEERARKLGGTFRLQTSTDAGTEVTVRVSFPAMRQRIPQEQHVIRWLGI